MIRDLENRVVLHDETNKAMSPGEWQQVVIAGKQVDLYEPPDPVEQNFAILFLHGHGVNTIKDNPAYTAELERTGLRAVCPYGARSWWLDVICDEFDAALTPLAFLHEELVPAIRDRWNVPERGLGLTGISMGGQGALQLAYRHPRAYPVVAAISPAIQFERYYGRDIPLDDMFDSAEDARQHTVTLHLNPLNWPQHQLLVCDPADDYWFEGVDRLAMKLASSGIPFETDFEISAGGHDWSYFNQMAPKVIEYLATRLEQESRRLV